MKGSGGTEGGVGTFFLGLALALGAAYFFFDSVRVSTAGHGVLSGIVYRSWSSGHPLQTTSLGLIFVPFFLGVVALFYDAKKRWAWILMWSGLAIIAVEILSRLHFYMQMKTTHLLMILVMLAAGTACMIRSYHSVKEQTDE